MKPEIAILYEHPRWFEPLSAALDRRGVSFTKILLTDHGFDLNDGEPPAPIIFSRVAMSGFLREVDHPIYYAAALFDHWSRRGARVINGASPSRRRTSTISLAVGTPEQVRERIEEYEEAGLDLLLLQMSPQAEEMDRFAEQVIKPMKAAS